MLEILQEVAEIAEKFSGLDASAQPNSFTTLAGGERVGGAGNADGNTRVASFQASREPNRSLGCDIEATKG